MDMGVFTEQIGNRAAMIVVSVGNDNISNPFPVDVERVELCFHFFHDPWHTAAEQGIGLPLDQIHADAS